MGAVSTNTKTSDKLVREKLTETLLKQPDTLAVIQELEVARGRARADVVRVSDGSVHAYEIKSDLDTLRRLPKQIRHYNDVFSTVTLVVGITHVVEALYVIPDWWGVIVAEIDNSGLRLSPIRQVQQNSNTDYSAISDMLRKHELMKVLSTNNGGNGCQSMSKQRLVRETRQEISRESLIEQFARTLIARDERPAPSLQIAL